MQQAPKPLPYKSLTDIRGVGPKNAKLLAAAGYEDMQAVERFYREVCSRDRELFRQHLQADLRLTAFIAPHFCLDTYGDFAMSGASLGELLMTLMPFAGDWILAAAAVSYAEKTI